MKNHLVTFWQSQVASARKNPTVFALRATILLLAIALFITKRTIWTPDTLLIIILVIGVIFGRAREVMRRFVPFLGMLIVYDSFRSIADELNKNVHYTEMINFDRFISFGNLPTSWLQSMWYHGHVAWYDFYFYSLYMMHFLVPVAMALLLWKFRPKLYWPFVWALVGMSFAAFITFVIFPASPPWMAKELGYIAEPLHRISSDVWEAMGISDFSEVYTKLAPNAVAAVPSLHSAYPLLATLFVWKAFGFRKTWWLMVYPLSVWVGVVYLGEHYVFDVVVGALYAIVAYVVALKVSSWYNEPHRVFRRRVATFRARLAFWRA